MTDKYLQGLGEPPHFFGIMKPKPSEMTYWLYLPVLMPFESKSTRKVPVLPRNCEYLRGMINFCVKDARLLLQSTLEDKYVYLTAKTMWVEPGSPGNRPGWHVDGFGSNGDLNYIWADKNPTEFAEQKFYRVSTDDKRSMKDMTDRVKPENIAIYPNRSLLRLNERVVHRVGPVVETGVRTFIKITVSDHQFRNAGNSHNHAFDYDWSMKPRGKERNLDHVHG